MSKEAVQLTIAEITLVFPNNTYAIIKGDEEVVTQLVRHLDGVSIEYTPTFGEPMEMPND